MISKKSHIVLLGGTGYIGQAFVQELENRRHPYSTLSRKHLDYTRFDVLLDYLQETKPDFLINASGFVGKPNVDACETAQADTIAGNILFPQTVAHACLAVGVPWGHVSSGCIYSGAKIRMNGRVQVEKDLMQPELAPLVAHHPESVLGYTETDPPNFSFRDPPCSFYSGAKAVAEEAIAGVGQSYIWRLRIPFDETDNPRNYLVKIQRYSKVYDNVNSVSHRVEFAKACLDLWERRAPFGVYNMTNPGFVTTRQVVGMIQDILEIRRPFEFWADDGEFYNTAAKTFRSSCVLDVSKLLATGVKIRPVEEALEHTLRQIKDHLPLEALAKL